MGTVYGSFTLPASEGKQVTLFELTKEALETADSELLATVTPNAVGDVAVITTVVDEVTYEKSSYTWDGDSWVATNGCVDADKAIIRDNIIMAGNYSQVGNLTKNQNGTATFATKGKSVMDALTEIFSKRLQPNNPTNPSLGNVTISRTGNVECGTKIENVTVSEVTFNPGSYQYGPATGVTASSWKTERISNNGTATIEGAGAGGAVTDDNAGAGFMIGDQPGDFSSLSYRVTAEHTKGAVANDNLGSPSEPPKKISAGSVNKTSGTITAFRKFFYGTLMESNASPDSDTIRSLTGSNAPCKNGQTFSITIPEGTKTVIIAYPSTFRDLTSVKDTEAFGTPITASFVKSLKQVEGASKYAGIEYKVYVYTPAAALGKNTYDVTI